MRRVCGDLAWWQGKTKEKRKNRGNVEYSVSLNQKCEQVFEITGLLGINEKQTPSLMIMHVTFKIIITRNNDLINV
jgi:hypothetical protein